MCTSGPHRKPQKEGATASLGCDYILETIRTKKPWEKGAAGGLDVKDERRPRRQRNLEAADSADGGRGAGRFGLGRWRERRRLEELDGQRGAGEAERCEGDSFPRAGLRGVSDGDVS